MGHERVDEEELRVLLRDALAELLDVARKLDVTNDFLVREGDDVDPIEVRADRHEARDHDRIWIVFGSRDEDRHGRAEEVALKGTLGQLRDPVIDERRLAEPPRANRQGHGAERDAAFPSPLSVPGDDGRGTSEGDDRIGGRRGTARGALLLLRAFPGAGHQRDPRRFASRSISGRIDRTNFTGLSAPAR